MTTSVLLIDDSALFRRGVAQLISAEPDFRVAGEAAEGRTGIDMATRLRPDLVLIDLNMKGMSGLEVLRALKEAEVPSRCVVLSVSDEERDILEAMRSGADGYLLKDLEPEDLCSRLRHAMRGNVVLADGVANVMAHAMRGGRDADATTPDFTEREEDILQRIATGLSNKEIARALGISDATVKVHIKNLLRKLKLKSRLEAAMWWRERAPRSGR